MPHNAVQLEINAMPSKYIRRADAAAYIQEKGLPCTTSTLAKYASLGGGPAYAKFGNVPVYTHADLDAWVESRMQRHDEVA